jgi:hypothetical protein
MELDDSAIGRLEGTVMSVVDVRRLFDSGASPREISRAVNGGLWVLLGRTDQGPVYSCGSCYRQRYTLVTPGAKLPERCPKCGAS